MLRAALSTILLLALACGERADPDPAHDAAAEPDAAPADGPAPDGAPAACPETFAGCAAPVDRTGMAAVTITTVGDGYSPPCIRVSAGTQVTIAASDRHPLRAAPCSPEDFIGAPPSGTTTTATYTPAGTGVYGYFCPVHGTANGAGMAGAIIVE